MLALELGDDILVVDSGLMFPDEEMLGIDLVIPDFRYLRERRSRARGVLLTHGPEDPVGGLPYLMRDLPDVPIYGTKLTLGLLRTKLKEHRLAERAVLREIAPGTPFQVGNASCDSYTVCHSIPDAVGFTIDTAFGTIVHSGDWKFNHTPECTIVPNAVSMDDRALRGLEVRSHAGRRPPDGLRAALGDRREGRPAAPVGLDARRDRGLHAVRAARRRDPRGDHVPRAGSRHHHDVRLEHLAHQADHRHRRGLGPEDGDHRPLDGELHAHGA